MRMFEIRYISLAVNVIVSFTFSSMKSKKLFLLLENYNFICSDSFIIILSDEMISVNFFFSQTHSLIMVPDSFVIKPPIFVKTSESLGKSVFLFIFVAPLDPYLIRSRSQDK